LQKRVATKEIKGRPIPKYQPPVSRQEAPSLKAPAQKVFLGALVQEFINLSNNPEYRQDSQAFEGLANAYRARSFNVREDEVDETLRQLQEDL
jgi:hypothetical protein